MMKGEEFLAQQMQEAEDLGITPRVSSNPFGIE